MSELKEDPELFFTETKPIKQLVCTRNIPFLVIICETHIRLLLLSTLNESELNKNSFTFFPFDKSGVLGHKKDVELSAIKGFADVQIYSDDKFKIADTAVENSNFYIRLVCILGCVKRNNCWTIGAFHSVEEKQEEKSEDTDVNLIKTANVGSGIIKIKQFLKLPGQQSVIAFCRCTLEFFSDSEIIAVLVQNLGVNNELKLLICETTSLEIQETLLILGTQQFDSNSMKSWRLTLIESTENNLNGTSLIFLWNMHPSAQGNIGVISLSSAEKKITLNFVGWQQLTLLKHSKKNIPNSKKSQLSIRRISGTPRSTLPMHAPFQLQWNLMVIWDCGIYQMYAANTDFDAVIQRNEPCLILMREFSIFCEPTSSSFVDCDVILLSSKVALELRWTKASEIVLVSLRSLVDGQAFAIVPTTLEIKLECSVELEFPAKTLLATSAFVDNTVFVFFTLKKQIYRLRFDQVNEMHNLLTSKLFSKTNIEASDKMSFAINDAVRSLQVSGLDEKKFQEIVQVLNGDGTKDLKILSSNTFEFFCRCLIDHNLLPLDQKILKRFIDLGLHSVFKYGISSPNTSELLIANFLQTIDQSYNLALLIESLSASRATLVSAIRKILTLDKLVGILEIIANWCKIWCVLPSALIKKTAPDLPSFERIIDFLGVLLDAKFMAFLQSQNMPAIKLLQELSNNIMIILLMKRHIQKVQGQIFAINNLHSDDIVAHDQHVPLAEFVTLDL